MASVSILNPVANMDGIEFIGNRGGVEQKFLLHREALEDIEYKVLETGPEMMQSFIRHKILIAEVAAKVLDDTGASAKTKLLQSLIV